MGTAREYHTQQVHYLRKTVNFNDANVGTAVLVGTLPAGAQIVDAVTNVLTVFNAGTTNVLTAGTNSSSYDNIIGSGDVAEGSTGGNRAAVATATAGSYASDTDVYAKYAQTGTAATTGKAVIVISYVPNNDL